MADKDLPTRLHWPADPLDPAVAESRPDQPDRSSHDGPTQGSGGGEPQWVLGDRNDVNMIRQEVLDLRHAVDDLAERVQLRQLRASFDELRAEVAALRRVVVEWPALDQLSSDVAAVRSHLIDIQANPPAVLDQLSSDVAGVRSQLLDMQENPPAPPVDGVARTMLEDLQSSVARLGSAQGSTVAGLAPLVQELGALRGDMAKVGEEVVALRRRITLRAEPASVLDEAQIEQIADAVLTRARPSVPAPPGARRR